MIAIVFCLGVLFGISISAEAQAARSDWSLADQSRMRLLLAAPADGRLTGGLEMLIEPGWHTYWRNPGDSGIPPEFDFSASTNVASVEVRYPAPERYDDGAGISLVYRDEVVFPLAIVPLVADAPVVLRVSARFGVCSEVCIPTSAQSEVTASPQPSASDPLADARIAQFETRVPAGPQPGQLDIEDVTITKDALLIDVRMPDSGYADLFADPPAGWPTGQPQFVAREDGVSRYRLALPSGAREHNLAGQVFRFVAVAGGDAVEEAIEIR
jgi:DsbC/DsbD-like thiol-disulfide interchange protein